MFEECLNINGWQKKAESECREFRTTSEYEKKLKEKLDVFLNTKSNFCSVNNCQYAPEICNEFVTVYLEEPGKN